MSKALPQPRSMLLVIPHLGRMQRRNALQPWRQRQRGLHALVVLVPLQQRQIARLPAAEQQVSQLDSSAADTSISRNHSIARVHRRSHLCPCPSLNPYSAT